MDHVKGTAGYGQAVERFTAATQAIPFAVLHQAFLDVIPAAPSHLLDVGAGIGRDASVLAERGHHVVAVEPTKAFLDVARRLYDAPRIQWVNDSLPTLAKLGPLAGHFDFVLASAMWHHLHPAEQQAAMQRIAGLICSGGIFALSLRHGPAGAGRHVFPTCGQRTIEEADACGLVCIRHLSHQPSLMAGKEGVTWTRLVLEKT